MRGLGEGGTGCRFVAARPAAHQVARRLVMDQRRAGCQRLRHGDDGGQALVVDHQQLGRVARLVERLRNDHRGNVADMAYLADWHRQVRRFDMAIAVGVLDLADTGQVAELVGRGVLRGVDRHHAGHRQRFRLVDTGNACMRVRRAHEQHRERLARCRVLGVAAAAGEEALVLAPRQRQADAHAAITSLMTLSAASMSARLTSRWVTARMRMALPALVPMPTPRSLQAETNCAPVMPGFFTSKNTRLVCILATSHSRPLMLARPAASWWALS